MYYMKIFIKLFLSNSRKIKILKKEQRSLKEKKKFLKVREDA